MIKDNTNESLLSVGDFLLDVHTHTIVSGHAFCTLNEMVVEAQRKGLKVYGITEHGPMIPGTCDPLYFRNMYIVPRQYGDMQLLMGAELNILDYEGNLDITDDVYWRCFDHVIAGLHQLCYDDGNRSQNTSALIGAIENPHVNIISHPCDGTASDFDIEAVVLAAKRTGTLLELNNSSLNPYRGKKLARPYFSKMLELCRKYDNPIIVSSDAHHTSQLADFSFALELLHETCFPKELIVNTDVEKFLQIIKH
ncbi:MAG: phosphatase [Bacteroidaceae bacterium]|nr:phosphatase [Bacteroidaceae bacterium]